MSEPFTIGVEEEYLVVDPDTGEARSDSEEILPTARQRAGDVVEHELLASQLEIGTPICHSLDDVRRHLRRLRSAVVGAAGAHGAAIAALGTHPFARWEAQDVTHRDRYEMLTDTYQQLARELVICGCHVHVEVEDRDVALRIMDRMRSWLPTLLVLSANSPYWRGGDTGYASYRTLVFGRLPTAGIPLPFGSRRAFDELVESLLQVQAIPDAATLYWDMRPSSQYETLEVRVADVCLSVDDAVAVAGLARSLVRSLHAEVVEGSAFVDVRPELLRIAKWRAARFGLHGDLIDPLAREEVTGPELVERLLVRCRADLEAHDEWDAVSDRVERILSGGNGADRQRAAYERRQSFQDVVALAVEESAGEQD